MANGQTATGVLINCGPYQGDIYLTDPLPECDTTACPAHQLHLPKPESAHSQAIRR